MSYTYTRLRMPGHPLADKCGMVLEHRLVLSQKLGRWLRREEHTHHLNGDRRDNRPENLVVTRNGLHQATYHPQGQKGPRTCAVCGTLGRTVGWGMCSRCYHRACYLTRNPAPLCHVCGKRTSIGRTVHVRCHLRQLREARIEAGLLRQYQPQAGKTCKCGAPAKTRGLCQRCYHSRWKKERDLRFDEVALSASQPAAPEREAVAEAAGDGEK
jgi:hypothetical protein